MTRDEHGSIYRVLFEVNLEETSSPPGTLIDLSVHAPGADYALLVEELNRELEARNLGYKLVSASESSRYVKTERLK